MRISHNLGKRLAWLAILLFFIVGGLGTQTVYAQNTGTPGVGGKAPGIALIAKQAELRYNSIQMQKVIFSKGSEITFEADIVNNGDSGDVKDLVLLVDDQPVPNINPRLQLGPAGGPSARK